MVPPMIPFTNLPVTVLCANNKPFTEKFSEGFKEILPSTLLREFGGIFASNEGWGLSKVSHSSNAIKHFCQYQSEIDLNKRINSIQDLTISSIYDFVIYLQRIHPSKNHKSKTSHPWHSLYKDFLTAIRPFIRSESIPYIPVPDQSVIESHSPYAMNLLLKALRQETDRIRGKIGKWKQSVKRGKIIDIGPYVGIKSGRQIKFTESQLDELEEFFFGNSYGLSNNNLMLKYRIAHKNIDIYRQKVRNNEELPLTVTNRFTEEELDELKNGLFLPERPSYSSLAERMSSTRQIITGIKYRWIKDGRPLGRDSFDIDFSIDDIVATIDHYLPDFPVVGHFDTAKPYRVYKSERGVLHCVCSTLKETEKISCNIKGHHISDRKDSRFNKRMNPAEMLIAYRKTSTNNSHISKLLDKLLPNGVQTLLDKYFATTYDWMVLYLYWLCLTGWNREAILSVNVLQLKRLLKNNGRLDVLSNEHTTLETIIDTSLKQGVPLMITGKKNRSQPKNKPMIFTYTSDRNDKYNLIKTLGEFYELSKPLRKYLPLDKANNIFIGASITNKELTSFGVQNAETFNIYQIHEFFKKHEVFEDPEHTIRIKSTDSRKLRATYFSTLQYMGVPITSLQFLGRHKHKDTTVSHYASNKIATVIKHEKARKMLEEVEKEIFQGTLKKYTNTSSKKHEPNTMQVFTHLQQDISVCLKPFEPTWDGNEHYIPRNKNGRTTKSCDHFHMCLLCKQCVITESTLPFLVKWDSDIREWKKKAGFTDFPVFMEKRFQAISEIFELCDASGEYWKKALQYAEVRALENDFNAPPIWRSI